LRLHVCCAVVSVLASVVCGQEAEPAATGKKPGGGTQVRQAPADPRLAALTAGEWKECLNKVAEGYAVPQQPTAMERRWSRKPTPQSPIVRFGVVPVAMAAASAQALGDAGVKEWSAKLYGDDPVGQKAFAAFIEMLGGKYQGLIPMLVALDPAYRARRATFRWDRAAIVLEEAAGTKPERQHWRDMAGAFRVLALWRRHPRTEKASLAMVEPFTKLTETTKAKIVDAIVSYEGSVAQRLRYSYYDRLLPLLAKGLVKDDQLARLLAHSAPDPVARAAMSGQVALHSRSAAAAIGKVGAELAKDDPKALGSAVLSLLQGGKREEAVALLRRAEPRLTYPERQHIRRQLLKILRGPRRDLLGPRRGPVLGQYPALRKEFALRRSMTDTAPGELAMVLGDLYSVAGATGEAAAAYGRAFGASPDPLVRRTAWKDWAAYQPKAAWSALGQVDTLFANKDRKIARELGELACHVVATGLVADDEKGALDWADKQLPSLARTRGRSQALGFTLLWRVSDPGGDPAAIVEGSAKLLAAMGDNGIFSLVESLTNQGRVPIRLTKSPLDGKLMQLLRLRTAGGNGWGTAIAICRAAMPTLRSPRMAPHLWQQVLRACPPAVGPDHEPGTPLSAEEVATEAARQQQCAALTDLCLARLGAAQPRHASLAGRACVEVAAGLLNGKQGKRFLPHCQALSAGALAQAEKLRMTGRSQVRFLRLHARGLKTSGASAADLAQFRKTVEQAFPKDPQIAQMLAELTAEGGK
jgi:hypothetical protein